MSGAYYTKKKKTIFFFMYCPYTSKKPTLYKNEINTFLFFTTTLYGITFEKYIRRFFIYKKSLLRKKGGFIFQSTHISCSERWKTKRSASSIWLVFGGICPSLLVSLFILDCRSCPASTCLSVLSACLLSLLSSLLSLASCLLIPIRRSLIAGPALSFLASSSFIFSCLHRSLSLTLYIVSII
jgi:hypothetical protein